MSSRAEPFVCSPNLLYSCNLYIILLIGLFKYFAIRQATCMEIAYIQIAAHDMSKSFPVSVKRHQPFCLCPKCGPQRPLRTYYIFHPLFRIKSRPITYDVQLAATQISAFQASSLLGCKLRPEYLGGSAPPNLFPSLFFLTDNGFRVVQ